MLSASGTECVRVLVGMGWMPLAWTESECRLQQRGGTLVVPLEPMLSPAQVSAIVEAAGVSPLAFVDALQTIRSGRVLKMMQDEEQAPRKAG